MRGRKDHDAIQQKFKLPLPDPKRYVPPFVTELDEPTIDDLLVATWTLGEVVTRKDGRPMRKKELSQLHNQLRSASGDAGFSNLGNFAVGVGKEWPQLRPLDRFINGGDFGRPITFDQLWERLQNGQCAVLQGNPSNVANAQAISRRPT